MLYEYTYIEFMINDKTATIARHSLDENYIYNLYEFNKQNEPKRAVVKISSLWYGSNFTYHLPVRLDEEYKFSQEFFVESLRNARLEELDLVCKAEYDKYVESRKDKLDYYELQEKELANYLTYQRSNVLTAIAEKKDIAVEDLAVKITEKINEHRKIVLNRKFLLDELTVKINQANEQELLELNLIDLVKQSLFETTTLDQTEFFILDQLVKKPKKKQQQEEVSAA